jgi:hypothetical protein
MSKLSAFVDVALDGVRQSPGGREEDPRGGFHLSGRGGEHAVKRYLLSIYQPRWWAASVGGSRPNHG